MPLIRVASLSEVAPDSVIEVMIEDAPIAICNVNGEVHALAGICPHRGGPLGQGAVNGNSVTCPWHAWDFDCRTGANDFDASQRVTVFPVKIESGEISVELPDA